VHDERLNDESGGMWASGTGLLAAVTGAVFMVLIVIWLAGFAYGELHAPVNADSLHDSIAIETGASANDTDGGKCTKPAGGPWECEVIEFGGSSVHDYRVKVRPGTSCWDAWLLDPNDPNAIARRNEMFSSCVHHFEGGWSKAIGI
jgi:hypothetical protein